MITFELSTPAISFELGESATLDVGFDVLVSAPPSAAYTGVYTVTPKIDGPVVLSTKNKTMRDDVTVRKIPQHEVSNEAGGNTLIMGDEYFG